MLINEDGVELKVKIILFKLEVLGTTSFPGLMLLWSPQVGVAGRVTCFWSQIQLTQLELFARPVWILSDPASVNRPGIDHRSIGEPVGRGSPHYEPMARNVHVRADMSNAAHRNLGHNKHAVGSGPAPPTSSSAHYPTYPSHLPPLTRSSRALRQNAPRARPS